MIRLTGSGMDRADQCPAAFALPAVKEPPSTDAQAGTDGHAVLETLARAGDASLAHVLGSGRRYVEVAYAYDPIADTARVLPGAGGHRDYGDVADHEIPATLDVVDIEAAGALITDWKLGSQYVSADTLQLTIAALAVSRAHGIQAVTVQIAQRNGADFDVRRRSLDAMDLDAAADQVRRIYERVQEARAVVLSGRTPDTYPDDKACQWCPCIRSCPAHVTLARSVLAMAPADVETRIAAMSPDEAGRLWLAFKSGETLLETIGKSLRTYASATPLELPDGRRVEMREQVQMRTKTIPDPSGEKTEIRFMKAQIVGKKGKAA